MSIFRFGSDNKWMIWNNMEIVGTEIKGESQQWQVTHVRELAVSLCSTD